MIKFDITEDKFIEETLYTATHESGVKIYIMPKKGYNKCHAMFATRYGSLESRFEKDGEIIDIPDGTAHFLEHKLFEEEDGNVFDKFSLLGASANAFTNFTATAYHFSATSNFYESLSTLIKFVQNPYFTKESIEKEQGIIGQEIKMYDDDPNWQVYFNLLGCLYNDCYVTHDIAGTVESISEINKDILYGIYSVFYHPSNMVLFIAGDVDIEKTASCIEESLADIKPIGEVKRLRPHEKEQIASSYCEKKLDVAVPLFALGFKDNDTALSGKDLLKKEIETDILVDMLFSKSSDIYKTLYEKGLINESFGADYECCSEYAFACVTGESKKPEKVRDIIWDMLGKYEIAEDDYERAKRVVWGRYVRMYNSTEALGYSFMLHFLTGINYFDYREVYESVSIDDIKARMEKTFDVSKSALSVVKSA